MKTLHDVLVSIGLTLEEIDKIFNDKDIQKLFIKKHFKNIKSFNDIPIIEHCVKAEEEDGYGFFTKIYFIFNYKNNPNYGLLKYYRFVERGFSYNYPYYSYEHLNFCDYINNTREEELFGWDRKYIVDRPNEYTYNKFYMTIEKMNSYLDEILETPFSGNNRYNNKEIVFASLSVDIDNHRQPQVDIKNKSIGFIDKPSLIVISKTKNGTYVLDHVSLRFNECKLFDIGVFLGGYYNWTLFENTIFNKHLDLSPNRPYTFSGKKRDDWLINYRGSYPLMSKRIPDELLTELKAQTMLDKI